MIKRVGRIHQLLIEQHFYPLLLSSTLALGLWAFRSEMWMPRSFRFLVWNLFLAWLPYFWSLWALSIHRRQPRRGWLLLLPGTLWLLFFPNAPYLVTDLIHLHSYPPVPLWYDVGLLITFAWTGCFLAVASLYIMHQIVREYTGRILSWLIVTGMMALCGLGIYVGRFLRWNSWDIFLYPIDVIGDIAHRLAHPFSNLQTYGVTLMFAAFLFVCYWTFVSLKQRA
ncbi:MAG TPA: DUF1361 domain-containing protein [Anaerolineae bacterium]|nr:DUF1361 domain-containing protein [Anaerolineae bacterium]